MGTTLLSKRTAKLAGIAALAAGCTVASSAQAAVIIPDKGGFSGYINVGVGGLTVESNMLASILSGKVDVGSKKVDSLNNSPDNSEDAAIPSFNFELSYTLEGSRTQFHIGNLLEDFLALDTNTVVGVRQDVGNAGLVGASYRTTSIATEVWSDPYLTGAKRDETDRNGDGFRVYWQQIMSSGLELRYTYTEIDIDKERSGESLALTPDQRQLLDRNGDIDRYTMLYEFSSDNKHHIITPALRYIDRDLDGQAMANDGYGASLNYLYKHDDRWSYVLNVAYTDMDFKEANPIYDYKDSSDSFGGSATVFYAEPFGWKNWSFNATAGWYEEDHDIDFYDSSVGVVLFGMFRKF